MVEPIEVVPMMLVALVVDEVEVDPPTEVPLDGAASDSATRVDEEVVPLAAVVNTRRRATRRIPPSE